MRTDIRRRMNESVPAYKFWPRLNAESSLNSRAESQPQTQITTLSHVASGRFRGPGSIPATEQAFQINNCSSTTLVHILVRGFLQSSKDPSLVFLNLHTSSKSSKLGIHMFEPLIGFYCNGLSYNLWLSGHSFASALGGTRQGRTGIISPLPLGSQICPRLC